MSDNNTDPAQMTDMQVRERIAELEKERDDAVREVKCSLIVLDGLKRRIRAAFEYWPDLAMFKDLSCLLNLKPSAVKLEAHNIEQQAKGLEGYVSKTMDNCYILHLDHEEPSQAFLINLNATALRLRNQAKALRGE